MSLKRQILAWRRTFKHRWFFLIVFSFGLLGFLFYAGYFEDDRVKSESSHVRASRHVKSERVGGENEGILLKTDEASFFKRGKNGNYEPKEIETRSGPGENGMAVPVDRHSHEVQNAMQEFGFNTFVSDKISLNRSIPDTRSPDCKFWSYPGKLPTASVVVVFHNEGWSPLLRTVHSVLLRSPPELLAEVLMVDDFSEKEHLKSRLETYIQQFQGKVRLIRNKEREGLIRSRSIGAEQSKGDVVIFLDAHCEVNANWLPPLLAPIAADRRVMTVPIIDGIDMWTWSYRRQYGGADSLFRGIFEWGLLYKETEIPARERKRRKQGTEPFRSPTHAGGLFAIDRKWFGELGFYDPGLLIWGGEQYELSFKIWQCGGGILFVPCSHVGHVYRQRMPYGFGKLKGPVISTNLKRVVEVWMDEYKKYYYIREPQMTQRDTRDISKQKELRNRLKCKSFKWYMEHVAYDVISQYPLLSDNKAWGELKNPSSGLCVDTMGQPIPGTIGVSGCHGFGGNQMFRLNMEGQFTSGEWCITPISNRLQTGHCVKGTANGPFEYNDDTQQIVHKAKNLCFTVHTDGPKLTLDKCEGNNEYQKFKWREIWDK